MRVLLQRVIEASIVSKVHKLGQIGRGILLFVGVTHFDDMKIAEYLAGKCANLRIFEDESHRQHHCSVLDLKLEALVVSQFTLYGNISKGRRPGFNQSASPEKAKELYEAFIHFMTESGVKTSSGIFRSDMQVKLINDGPVTYLLEKEKDD